MSRQIRLLTLAILALFISAPVFAASHREAPLIANDPAADITDLYLFRSWQDSDKAIVIMNVIPGQEPGSGPNYFNFADDVLYEIHIDNNKNNIAGNLVYQIRFKTEIRQPGDVFPLAYVALPPITALAGSGSEGLLVRQSYTVTEVRFGQQPKNIGTGPMYAVPSNVGARTTPNYEQLAAKGIFPLKNGGRVFAGQRDETFSSTSGEPSTRSTSMCLQSSHLPTMPTTRFCSAPHVIRLAVSTSTPLPWKSRSAT